MTKGMTQMMITVRAPKCLHCGEAADVEMTEEQYAKFFIQERKIQDVFPDWTPGAREVLLSGTHPECWDAMLMGTEE